jgi:NAD(P)-dependent dehydrogenase (short-subunit alcohol dehydrogenase family)
MSRDVRDLFDLTGRVAVITGGAGLLGVRHATAIASAGGIPVLVDIACERVEAEARRIAESKGAQCHGIACDITSPEAVQSMSETIAAQFGNVDILINNAANNPKMESTPGKEFTRLEDFPIEQWEADVAVGLTGAFLCSRAIGSRMAVRGSGVIVNVSSDLGLIAPDQRLYRRSGTADDLQPVKPVTYSVVKSGLIGLTKYLATYWAGRNVRVNAVCPGGVYHDQSPEFVTRLSNLIPLGRMARADEYEGTILYLCSDASSYMTGATLVVDGGRTAW